MLIDIGKAAESTQYMNKRPTFSYSNVSIRPTSDLSLESPRFVVSYKSEYLDCNYIWCGDFNRFYYIVDRIVEIGESITLICKSDPVASFLPSLLTNIVVTVIRKNIGSPTYFPDPQYAIDPVRKEYKCLYFYNESNYPFTTSNNYLLEVQNSAEAPYQPTQNPQTNP